MAKDLPYLKFNAAEWINGDITLEDDSAQGVFVNICAHYWFKSGKLTLSEIKRRLYKSKAKDFDALIKSGIIKVDNDIISISFLDEQLEERGALSKQNSVNGSKGGRGNKREKATALEIESENKATALFQQSDDKAKKSNIEERREEERREEEIIPPNPLTSTQVDVGVGNLETRKQDFVNQVRQAAQNIYTPQMIENFIGHWTEPDRAKNPKMKFEKQKTWETGRRLKTWADRNLDGIVCYLADMKSIKEKQKEFAETMKPFAESYEREMMNAFYRHWSQPENKSDPKKLKWEHEEFWDLSARLKSWKERTEVKPEEKAEYKIPVAK